MTEFAPIDGGITAPQGFCAAGVHAGIKKSGAPDMALIVSDPAAHVAGTFTTNRIQGATVRLCRERLQNGRAAAVIINSGNANACTGPEGDANAARMGSLTAKALGAEEDTVFVCSTGTIGVPLPMDKIETGIRAAADALSPDGGGSAARAIMTTDTVDKQFAIELSIGGQAVRLGGMTKGAGMIEPNMATMLAFLATDAAVEPAALQECLVSAVDDSFNRVSVDGDQSCNDTVLFMANGAAGNEPLGPGHVDWPAFSGAVAHVARELALKIVADGEGATKLVTVNISGAATIEDARKAARAVANSLLVKTSWYGCDPNWGRVIDAVGYSGADVREALVDIRYDDFLAVHNGQVAGDTALADLERVLRQDRFSVNVDLNLGDGTDTVYTCDCSEEYVRINSEYTT
ncbi:bifunctional glutamate N-acetyltransferase/amino-acid acetyltransferase ArgJ [Verrucomicrobiota bacterium]